MHQSFVLRWFNVPCTDVHFFLLQYCNDAVVCWWIRISYHQWWVDIKIGGRMNFGMVLFHIGFEYFRWTNLAFVNWNHFQAAQVFNCRWLATAMFLGFFVTFVLDRRRNFILFYWVLLLLFLVEKLYSTQKVDFLQSRFVWILNDAVATTQCARFGTDFYLCRLLTVTHIGRIAYKAQQQRNVKEKHWPRGSLQSILALTFIQFTFVLLATGSPWDKQHTHTQPPCCIVPKNKAHFFITLRSNLSK